MNYLSSHQIKALCDASNFNTNFELVMIICLRDHDKYVKYDDELECYPDYMVHQAIASAIRCSIIPVVPVEESGMTYEEVLEMEAIAEKCNEEVLSKTAPAIRTIINCTPHDVHVLKGGATVAQTFKQSGKQIRLRDKFTYLTGMSTVDGSIKDAAKPINLTPIVNTKYGKVTEIPEEEGDTYYIVSRIVRSALPDRSDLLVPVDLVRDANNRIIGCRALSIN